MASVDTALVIHTGGIGDFLLACPSIARLSEDGPVTVCGNRNRVALAVAGGIAQAARDIDEIEFHTIFSEPSDKLKTFLRQFTRVVVWMKDDDGVIAGALSDCGVERIHVAAGLPPDDWEGHASNYYLQSLGYAAHHHFRLNVKPSSDSHDVIIHPGSGSVRKNWAREHFLTTANILEEHGRKITWCLGPAEDESLDSGDTIRVHSLTDLASILAATKLYIGNDSGITHLAAAVGCTTVAIFVSTDPETWAPIGDHVTTLHSPSWQHVVRCAS